MSESCKQAESPGIGTQSMLLDMHRASAFLTMPDIHMHSHTLKPQLPPHSLPYSSSPLALYGSAAHQQLLEECSNAFQSRAEEGRAGSVALCGPARRKSVWEREGIFPANCTSLPLFFTPSVISRAASGATAKLLLSCHSGTDDKAGLFTGRRDPWHSTHTYGRQEWKEGI